MFGPDNQAVSPANASFQIKHYSADNCRTAAGTHTAATIVRMLLCLLIRQIPMRWLEISAGAEAVLCILIERKIGIMIVMRKIAT